jgi:hypothetical protein
MKSIPKDVLYMNGLKIFSSTCYPIINQILRNIILKQIK